MLRARPLLLIVMSALLLPPAVAQSVTADNALPTAVARYTLQARVAPPAGRFALGDAQIDAKRLSKVPRFALLTATAKGGATCAPGDALFADGFED